MPELNEVFDDIGETVSDGVKGFTGFIKKNPFMIAAGAVVVVAFLVYLKNRNSVETTNESATFYTYPTTGGGTATFQGESVADSLYYDILAEMNDKDAQHKSELAALQSEYGEQFSEMESVVAELTGQTKTLTSQVEENQTALKRSQLIAQMEANSDMYILTDDEVFKDQLHAENMSIAEQLGLTFREGSYYDSAGTLAYQTALQTFKRTEQNTPTSGTMKNNATHEKEYLESIINEAVSNALKSNPVSVETSAPVQSSTTTKKNVVSESVTTQQNQTPTPAGSATKNTGLYTSSGKTYATASDNKPMEWTQKTSDGKTLTSAMPSSTRDKSRAGQTVESNGYKVRYDDMGYVVAKVRV